MAEMKLFLYGILSLIKDGKSESVSFIEATLEAGIATALYGKYTEYFDSICFHPDNLPTIDAYYRNYTAVADGREHIFACTEPDGLYLLIKLVLEQL